MPTSSLSTTILCSMGFLAFTFASMFSLGALLSMRIPHRKEPSMFRIFTLGFLAWHFILILPPVAMGLLQVSFLKEFFAVFFVANLLAIVYCRRFLTKTLRDVPIRESLVIGAVLLIYGILVISHPIYFEWDVSSIYLKNSLGYLASNTIPRINPMDLSPYTSGHPPLISTVYAFSLFVSAGVHSFRLLGLLYIFAFLWSVRRMLRILSPEDSQAFSLSVLAVITASLPATYFLLHQNGCYPDFAFLSLASLALASLLEYVRFRIGICRALFYLASCMAITAKPQALFLAPLLLAFSPFRRRLRLAMFYAGCVPLCLYIATIGMPLKYGFGELATVIGTAILFLPVILVSKPIFDTDFDSGRRMKVIFLLCLGLPLLWSLRNALFLGSPTYPFVIKSISGGTINRDFLAFSTLGGSALAIKESVTESVPYFLDILSKVFIATSLGSIYLIPKLLGLRRIGSNTKDPQLIPIRSCLMIYASCYFMIWIFVLGGRFDGAALRTVLPLLPIVLMATVLGLLTLSEIRRYLAVLSVAAAFFALTFYVTVADLGLQVNQSNFMFLDAITSLLLLSGFAYVVWRNPPRGFRTFRMKLSASLGHVTPRSWASAQSALVAVICVPVFLPILYTPWPGLIVRALSAPEDGDLFLARETGFYYNYHEVIDFVNDHSVGHDRILIFQDIGVSCSTKRVVLSMLQINPIVLEIMEGGDEADVVRSIQEADLKHIIVPNHKAGGLYEAYRTRFENTTFNRLLETNLLTRSTKICRIDGSSGDVPGGSDMGLLSNTSLRNFLFEMDLSVGETGLDPWNGALIILQNPGGEDYLQVELRRDGWIAVVPYQEGKRGTWVNAARFQFETNRQYHLTMMHAEGRLSVLLDGVGLVEIESPLPQRDHLIWYSSSNAEIQLGEVKISEIQSPFEKTELTYWSVYTVLEKQTSARG